LCFTGKADGGSSGAMGSAGVAAAGGSAMLSGATGK
jgi:hypothetical protein